jgi:hypothetical protein
MAKVTTALALLLMALAGCGDDEAEPEPGSAPTTTTTTTQEVEDPSKSPACRSVAEQRVARAIAEAGGRRRPLERSSNDSLDLSICEFREVRGPELYVSIALDTAANTARRYYNLIAEARQRATFEAIPDSTKPVGVRGVGNDRAHGGVGAYWTRYGSQLTAVDDQTLVKIRFNVPGAGGQASKAAATELARAVFGGPSGG